MKRTLVAIGLLTGCAGRLSESQEYYVGRAVAARSIAETKGGVHEDEALHEYVAKVGWTIALASDRPDTYQGYHFLVLHTNEVGAWAAPSGFIFVTTGALALMENEDQLAAVLAHEIAHVALKHPEEVAQKEASKAGIMDVLALGGEALKALGQEEWAKLLEGFGGCVDEGLKRGIAGYGRESEMAADKMGIDFLTRAEVGYNPGALADFLTRLPQREGEAATGPYATHPGAQERIDAIRADVQKRGLSLEIDPGRTTRYRQMTARLHP